MVSFIMEAGQPQKYHNLYFDETCPLTLVLMLLSHRISISFVFEYPQFSFSPDVFTNQRNFCVF